MFLNKGFSFLAIATVVRGYTGAAPNTGPVCFLSAMQEASLSWLLARVD